VKELNLSIRGSNCIPSFAGIDAHPSIVIYFPHNGYVLRRVAIRRAKADNTASQTKGEKS
jgi:hypothetical protein